MADGFSSLYVTAPDGLKLHLREYGSRLSPKLPVVCLAGLTRNSGDFHTLASALADGGWRVVAPDSRGRGQSDYDRNPDNYSIPVELGDVIAVITALEIAPAVFIGTSRGGLLTMALAAVRPTAIAGAVLNDIGPVIDKRGLLRIKSYVGRLARPRTFEEGADAIRRLFEVQFPKLGPADWRAFAMRTWRNEQGQLVPTYDVAIARTLADIDPETPLPDMWAQFDALGAVPVMVIRGAHSDILSPATLREMRTRRPDLEVLEVPDQGHAPLLAERETIARITTFLDGCEARRRHRSTL
jgi:pimeloyl-ACP methyl ester carboxylesterase